MLNLALSSAVACQWSTSPTTEASVEEMPASLVVGSGDAFLAELLPLPGDRALAVAYRVIGPGGVAGTLELWARPGGFRRERWELELPMGGTAAKRLAGTTVQTPDAIWSGTDGTEGTVSSSPLGRLASSWAALPAEQRHAVVTSVRRWHDDLDRARREHPGETQVVAGQACLSMRVASQTICVWEETGILLRYEGTAFTVEAQTIERDARLSVDAFAIPAGAKRGSSESSLAAEDALSRLAAGEYAHLALELQAGFRLSDPVGGMP